MHFQDAGLEPMVEPNGEAFGGHAAHAPAHERAAGPQFSGMTDMRQHAQKSSTRPEEGELGFELGWSDFTPQLESRCQKLPAVKLWSHSAPYPFQSAPPYFPMRARQLQLPPTASLARGDVLRV